jgi:ectoine hydroxylase-related dioxygenase (phytanoyl-CoA dioxygenase family)
MTPALETSKGYLGSALKQQYQDDGFLFPIQAVSSEQAAAWRAELEDVEAKWLNNGLPKPLNQYRRSASHIVMPLAAEIASHPAILNSMSGILGDDLMIWSCEFFIKEANTTHIVSWHQDLTYWGLGETSDQCTAWLALSPATVASGCMNFVAGSHKNAIVPHTDTFDENNLLSRGQEIAVDADEDKATAIELQPGQMSLHHGLTFHGSGPNTSDDRRIGVAIRYVNPNAMQQVADRDYAMLVRGADRSGNFINIARPADYFEPHALKMHDEVRNDKTSALSAGLDSGTKMYTGSGKTL